MILVLLLVASGFAGGVVTVNARIIVPMAKCSRSAGLENSAWENSAWELARWAIEAKMDTRSILESWISQKLCTLWSSHLRICQVNILGGWNITPFFFFFTNETENHFFS